MSETNTLPCPGCHTPLSPEDTGCQVCMRQRTRQEIMRGYAKLREERGLFEFAKTGKDADAFVKKSVAGYRDLAREAGLLK